MRIVVSCAYCGEESSLDLDQDSLSAVPTTDDMIAAATKAGWIAQENGEHIDLYCTEVCAE